MFRRVNQLSKWQVDTHVQIRSTGLFTNHMNEDVLVEPVPKGSFVGFLSPRATCCVFVLVISNISRSVRYIRQMFQWKNNIGMSIQTYFHMFWDCSGRLDDRYR